MAQLFTDFSEYPAGSSAHDWSYQKRNAGSEATLLVADIPDGPDGTPINVYRMTSHVNDRQMVSWNKVNAQPDRANSEQLMLMRWTKRSSTSANFEFRPAARYGDLSAAVYYTAGLTANGLVITRQNTNIAQAPFFIDVGVWSWVRFRVDGNVLSAKTWLHGEVEPSNWTLHVTDSTYSTGNVGIFFFEEGQTIELARTGVGTGGDVAPMFSTPTVITANEAPFSASWAHDATGTYTITPVARNADGETVSGEPVQITIT